MRLDNYLLRNHLVSSKKILKMLLKSQHIKVNDSVVFDGRFDIEGRLHRLFIQGKEVAAPYHRYYMMNKPQGYLTAKKDGNEKTIFDLLLKEDITESLFPVGRLDRDTEGLLILTDNGSLGFKLFMPNYFHQKKYFAILDGMVTQEDIHAFNEGIQFHDGTICRPARLEIISSDMGCSEIYLTLTEGKYHQVKKMALSRGKRVKYLKRIEMAGISLDNSLKIGEYRSLTHDEVRLLFQENLNLDDKF